MTAIVMAGAAIGVAASAAFKSERAFKPLLLSQEVVVAPASSSVQTPVLASPEPSFPLDVHEAADSSVTELVTHSESGAATSTSADDIRWFNGRPARPARTMTMVVTAYSPDAQSCGDSADGITASGYSVWTNGMKLVAADTRVLPFGSMLTIPGYDAGAIVPVLDRGGAIKGNRLDVLFPSHEEALAWGVRTLEVTIWEYADGLPDDFRENHR